MKRMMIQFALSLSLCPLALAQVEHNTSAVETEQPNAVTGRAQAIQSARTICIHSETAFLTVSTLERALMKEKNWDQLGLNILGGCTADLQIDVDRLHFTHIHTYVLTDKRTGIVLAANRVRALDGVVASGPMAEQIVKVLSSARIPTKAPVTSPGSPRAQAGPDFHLVSRSPIPASPHDPGAKNASTSVMVAVMR